jgi:hypothetical protein
MESSHDYVAQLLHDARAAELRAAADRRRLVREARQGRRGLARLVAPASVLSLPRRRTGQVGRPQGDDREAA